jgi:putative heme-binding domain-containing protein
VLALPKLPRANSETRLVEIIKEGIGAMPASWQLSAAEVRDVAAYIRLLGQKPVEAAPGDPARGAAVFREKGCGGCHIVAGQGIARGPELTGIGALRSLAHLRESITTPAAYVAPEWWVFEAVQSNGARVRGTRINDDSFTIQLRDAAGKVHSLRRLSLKKLTKEDVSFMPAFALAEDQLTNLVAYLASLKELP